MGAAAAAFWAVSDGGGAYLWRRPPGGFGPLATIALSEIALYPDRAAALAECARLMKDFGILASPVRVRLPG